MNDRTNEGPVVPVILCGGAGTRLWPASRESYPKQFLPLLGGRSTFEETLARVADPSLFAAPLVVTGESFRFLAADQVTRAGVEARIVLEPMRRDSGPAVGLAAELARLAQPDAIVLVLAADHRIDDPVLFRETVRSALPAARRGAIVTFGVTPTGPATGYGYIRPGEPFEGAARRVERFIEKPDAERAARLIADGCLWNSGNFLFRCDVLLTELDRFEPAIADAVRRAAAVTEEDVVGGARFVRIDAGAFGSAPAKSIDYAVMEKTTHAAVVPAPYGWSDVGSWNALWEIGDKDADGNVASGPATFLDVHDCYVASEGIAIGAVGVRDLAIVATPDAVLVARRDVAGEMKELHARLAAREPRLVESHVRVHRPWGWYQSVDLGDRFQVKRICVSPGARLSLQKHMHRAEHWIVVRGTAVVTIEGEERLLRENESIQIPLGAWHRLANPGRIPLELVEVQSGAYLGEDDIIRSEDDYNRG